MILWLPLLTTALYHLLARATVTEWLWSKYPPALDRFLSCAACSGFWYGFFLALLLIPGADRHILHLDGPICVGLASMVWTPIMAGLQEWGLGILGQTHGTPE